MNRFLTAIVSLALLCGVADARLLGVNPIRAKSDILCNGGSPTGTNNEICHDYLGDWGPTSVGGYQTLGTSAFPWDGIYLGTAPSTALPVFEMLGSISTTTIAASNLKFSEFIAVNASGGFLAVCISTGGVGGSVLASDGVTPCYGSTFALGAPGAGPLGSDSSFVLMSTGTLSTSLTVTNSSVTGNVGSAGTSYTNTNSIISGSTITPISAQNATDFNTAYTSVGAAICPNTITGTQAGVTLQPGVYCFTAAATLTGNLTLNGTANSVFIIQAGTGGSGGITGTSFNVLLGGGQKANNVYWWAHDAITFTDSGVQGTFLSGAAATITRGSLVGRIFAPGTVTTTGPGVGYNISTP